MSCYGPPTITHSNPEVAKNLKPVRPDECYDPEELAAGMLVEAEHSDDPELQKIIVKNHLDEFMVEPGEHVGYYDLLADVERMLLDNEPAIE